MHLNSAMIPGPTEIGRPEPINTTAHPPIGARKARHMRQGVSGCDSAESGALGKRLPDPMDAAMAFRSVVEAEARKRTNSKPHSLRSRLPDPMDAVRIFRVEMLEAQEKHRAARPVSRKSNDQEAAPNTPARLGRRTPKSAVNSASPFFSVFHQGLVFYLWLAP